MTTIKNIKAKNLTASLLKRYDVQVGNFQAGWDGDHYYVGSFQIEEYFETIKELTDWLKFNTNH